MDPALFDLIRDHRAESGNSYTHVSFYGPAARWNIPAENLGEFWQKYCSLPIDSITYVPFIARKSFKKFAPIK